MDDFSSQEMPGRGQNPYDSLAEALFHLEFFLGDDIRGLTATIRDFLGNAPESLPPPALTKISRKAGELAVYKYVRDTVMALEDPYTDAGRRIRELRDDPAHLPDIMGKILFEMKFRHASGTLVHESMVTLPAALVRLLPADKALKTAESPEEKMGLLLDRPAVARGNGAAIDYLETGLFPIFAALCPEAPPSDNARDLPAAPGDSGPPPAPK